MPTIKPLPLRLLLIIPILLLVLGATGLVAWISLRNSRVAIENAAVELRVEVLKRLQHQLEEYLVVPGKVNRGNAQALASGLLDLDDPENVQRYFYAVLKANPSLAYSFFGDTRGEFYGARRMPDGTIEVVRAGRSTGGDSHYFTTSPLGDALQPTVVYRNFDPRVRPWYQSAVEKDGSVWSPLYRHFVIKDLALTAALPFHSPTGELLGVFGVDFVLTQIHDFLHNLKVGEHGKVFIMENDGNLVAASTALPEELMREKDGSFTRIAARNAGQPWVSGAARLIEDLQVNDTGAEQNGFHAFDLDGSRQLLQIARYKDDMGLDWVLAVVVPESDFLQPIVSSSRKSLVLMGLAVFVTVILGIFITSRIAAPIEVLSRNATALTEGWKLEATVPTSIGEIRKLEDSFRSMAQDLNASLDKMRGQNEIIAEQNRTLEQRVEERTRELHDMHNRLRAMFNAIPGHIHVIDNDYRVIDVSDRLLEQLSLERETVIGGYCYEALFNQTCKCPDCLVELYDGSGAVTMRPATEAEEAVLGGAHMNYFSPILDEGGKIWGYIQCLMDISDLKAMEVELRKAKEVAEEANQAKSEFLAKMSHEIRTPMNSIIGLTALTLQTKLDGEQRDHLTTVQEAGRSLLSIIEDILDFAKVEARVLELRHEHFSLPKALSSVVKIMRVQAWNKGLGFKFRIHQGGPKYVVGDQGRLRQMLLNLVGNAVKFTASGEVGISVALETPEPDAQNRLSVRISVWDTGPGIPEDKRELIFEPFRQSDANISRRYGGTGLGLAITRQIVELMGGRIRMESDPGKGSAFHLVIPFPQGEFSRVEKGMGAEDSLNELRQRYEPLNILLAEDNPMNVKLATALLNRLGHRVKAVGDGREVLERLSRERFDVVLMDVEMPDMDGLLATSHIRMGAAGERNREIPVIALTAHALSSFRQKCIDAGMNYFITKPIDFAEVAALLGSVGRKAPEASKSGIISEDLLDLRSALAKLGYDKPLYLELWEVFREQIPEHLEMIEKTVQENDLTQMLQLGHYIKNSCGVMGAMSCWSLAAEIEMASKDEDAVRAARLLLELEDELRKLGELRISEEILQTV